MLKSLPKSIRQSASGIMVPITVCSAKGGAMLKRHSFDPKTTMTSAYFVSMIKTDVFP